MALFPAAFNGLEHRHQTWIMSGVWRTLDAQFTVYSYCAKFQQFPERLHVSRHSTAFYHVNLCFWAPICVCICIAIPIKTKPTVFLRLFTISVERLDKSDRLLTHIARSSCSIHYMRGYRNNSPMRLFDVERIAYSVQFCFQQSKAETLEAVQFQPKAQLQVWVAHYTVRHKQEEKSPPSRWRHCGSAVYHASIQRLVKREHRRLKWIRSWSSELSTARRKTRKLNDTSKNQQRPNEIQWRRGGVAVHNMWYWEWDTSKTLITLHYHSACIRIMEASWSAQCVKLRRQFSYSSVARNRSPICADKPQTMASIVEATRPVFLLF